METYRGRLLMMTPEPDKKQGKAIDDYFDARKDSK